MAHAVVRTGGKQFLIEEGQTIRVPLVSAEAGQTIELDALVTAADDPRGGAPAVEGIKVSATVIDHGRGQKIIVFKKKRRKQYKRKQGHRQDYTTIRIESIG